MADLFRKKAIDRLSSPEQLDKMIPITQPSTWLILLGSFIIVISVGIWAIFGEITETYTSQGIVTVADDKLAEAGQESYMLLCFIQQSDAGSVSVGMPISAQTNSNAELKGQIIQTDSYITPSDEVYSLLQNDVLAAYFLSNGPVIAVRCSLEGDVESVLGALAQVTVITSKIHPIAYILPM